MKQLVQMVFLAALVAIPAHAQDDGRDGLIAQLKEALTRLEGYEKRISDLEDAIASIPNGAVVAFDLPNGCPAGWKADISAAEGRMIVGVKPGTRFELPYKQGEPDYQIGGTEDVTLEIGQMPLHGHRISTDYATDDIHNGLAGGSRPAGEDMGILSNFEDLPNGPNWTRVLPNVLEHTGGIDPIEILPPYIPLYLCKKGS